jgi:hypothetical protein
MTMTKAEMAALIRELCEALEGVVRVADRKTDEFDAARAAIVKARGVIIDALVDAKITLALSQAVAQTVAEGEQK